MTCILVLENAKVDETVSVSAYAATMPKVKLYVKCGEHYTVRELLFSLMLESHNDTAVVLGEYIGGKLWERRGRSQNIPAKRARRHYIDLRRQ